MKIKQINFMTVVISLVLLGLGFYGLIEGIGGSLSCIYLLTTGLIGYWLLGGNLRTLIRPLRGRDIGRIPVAMIATFAIGSILAVIGTHVFGFPTSANGVFSERVSIQLALMMIGLLFGEEMLVVVLLTILEKYLPQKRSGYIIATIISCLIFGALHLGTYDWNIWQSVIVIGFTRLPFTYMWYKSNRNLLANGLTHWAYDLILIISVGGAAAMIVH